MSTTSNGFELEGTVDSSPDSDSSSNSAINSFNADSIFLTDLKGVFGAYNHNTKVKVRSIEGNYIVYRAFPVLTAENTFTLCYLLFNADDCSQGLFCPEMFCYLADNPENIQINLENVDNRFTYSTADLKGNLGSYPADSLVKTKFSDKVYKVVLSFLMLNSDNSSIICYQLTDLKNKTVLYCPHSFLTRFFEL